MPAAVTFDPDAQITCLVVKGLTVVGPLPAGIELNTLYGAAATADSAAGDAAAAFVKFMAAPENRGVWKHAGFDPPGS